MSPRSLVRRLAVAVTLTALSPVPVSPASRTYALASVHAATLERARAGACRSFAEKQVRDPWTAENMVIHEMLHTLGLGENPPSSREITRRVNDRCQ